jgi:nucleoside-diphosphate-sugar epimerase
MQVLITGGAGYVGSQAASHFLSLGHTVRVFDALLYGAESLLSFANHPRFELMQGDVRDGAALGSALNGVEEVIHLASVVGEPACKIAPEFSWATNHDAVKTLCAATNGKAKKLIFVSTCSNYGVSAPNVEVDEDAGLNPLSDYAKAKVAAEKHLLENSTVPALTILRLGTICGLSARMRFDLLVSEMAKEAALGRTLQIYAPQAWRPYLHVIDAARAFADVVSADASKTHKKIFNVVAENLRKTDLLSIAQSLVPDVKHSITDKQPDLRDYRVSSARFNKEFNFSYTRTIKDGFAEVLSAVQRGVFPNPDDARHTATSLKAPAMKSVA